MLAMPKHLMFLSHVPYVACVGYGNLFHAVTRPKNSSPILVLSVQFRLYRSFIFFPRIIREKLQQSME